MKEFKQQTWSLQDRQGSTDDWRSYPKNTSSWEEREQEERGGERDNTNSKNGYKSRRELNQKVNDKKKTKIVVEEEEFLSIQLRKKNKKTLN